MRQPSVAVGCLLQLLSLSQAHSSLEQYYDAFLPIQKAAEAEEEMQRKSGLVQVQAPGEPPRPVIPRRFGANMHVFTTSMGTPTQGRGYFAQDVDLKANRVESLASYFIQGADSNMTTLSIGNMTWIETGGNHPNCRYLPMMGRQGFHDLFAWASNPTLSEYAGQRSVAGRSCALWRFRFGSSAVNQSLCTDGNSPVELNISYRNLSSAAAVKESFVSYQFDPLSTEVDSSLLEKPDICDHVAPACENGRGVEPAAVDAYVFHPGLSAGDYSIEDQNVADLVGDALFICFDVLGNQSSFADHNYSLISRYSLQVSPAFGQYAACNGYPDTSPPGPVCVGGDSRLVGKEAPFFMGDGESRCADKSVLGFWYSLPKSGRCPPQTGPAPSAWETGCTWSIVKREKTINRTCLLDDHHFLANCKADMASKSFARSTAALSAAFASEDLSKGGCPDIGGPSLADATSIIV